jgi:hypothetical protein
MEEKVSELCLAEDSQKTLEAWKIVATKKIIV